MDVLRYACVQLLERLVRAERYVTVSHLDIGTSSDRIVAAFRGRIDALRAGVLEAAATLGSPLSREEWGSVGRTIGRLFNNFDELHLRLAYIHGRWTTPEIEVFVRSVFEDIAQTLKVTAAVSVVPSDKYVFEEFDLDLFLRPDPESTPRGTPTLFLPKIEVDNPLHWCSLVHEFAHTLVRRSAHSEHSTVMDSWRVEAFCDQVALQILGPSYVASFVDYMLATAASEFLEESSETHPDPRLRVTSMVQTLETDEVRSLLSCVEPNQGMPNLDRFFYQLFEDRCEFERQHLGSGFKTDDRPDIDVREFRRTAVDRAKELVPESLRIATYFEPSKFKFLQERLERGIPIGTYHENPLSQVKARGLEELGAIRDVMNENGDPNTVAERLDTLRAFVTEHPTTAGEILTAGWLYKIDSIYAPMIEGIATLSEQRIEEFREKIFRLDDILRSSIETSYLGKLFVDVLGKVKMHDERSTAAH